MNESQLAVVLWAESAIDCVVANRQLAIDNGAPMPLLPAEAHLAIWPLEVLARGNLLARLARKDFVRSFVSRRFLPHSVLVSNELIKIA
jgi:hypothetical protein